ncbi:MAG: carbonic anhydrase [Planctomycetota bacterium]
MPDAPNILFNSDEPFDAHRIHALAVYCSDGRYGEQFDDFLHNHLKLPRYDRLAVPGGPACLTGHYSTANELAGIRSQIQFLIEAHGLEHVVLIQHHGCAFYAHARADTDAQAMRPDQDHDLSLAKAEILRMAPGLKVTTAHARLVDNHVSFESVETDEN